jgi:hypothetical protein
MSLKECYLYFAKDKPLVIGKRDVPAAVLICFLGRGGIHYNLAIKMIMRSLEIIITLI